MLNAPKMQQSILQKGCTYFANVKIVDWDSCSHITFVISCTKNDPDIQ